MDPSANSVQSHKLPCLCEEFVDDDVSFISICESWLKPHITNAQINIPNYQIIRQDRIIRDRGGVLLYVHNSLPTSDIATFDDDTCAAVICYVKSINTIIASIYRPPKASVDSFNRLLSFLQTNISKISNEKHCDLIINGDFNFPNLTWQPSDMARRHDESENLLFSFMEENLLSQYITQPTRNQNIIDLFLTNNANLVLQTQSINTKSLGPQPDQSPVNLQHK